MEGKRMLLVDDRSAMPDAASRALTLTKRERLALQLTGHGFCAAELAQMVGEPLERITRILKRATRALGAADVAGAVQEARRRGLLA